MVHLRHFLKTYTMAHFEVKPTVRYDQTGQVNLEPL